MRYRKAIIDYLNEIDSPAIQDNNLMDRVREREEQSKDMFNIIVEQQKAHEKVDEIQDFMEKVRVLNRITMEANSIVMRDLVLTPL